MKIVHRLPAADYHASAGVSNSSLKWFRKSPAHYKAFRDGKIEQESTKPQQIGTLAHALILEGKADFVTAPATYPEKPTKSNPVLGDLGKEKPWNMNANYCKDWVAHQTKPVISADQAATLRAAQAAIKSHPLASSLLTEGQPEVSLYATCPKTQLLLKCRIDWLKKRAIVDLKTAADASTGGFSRAMASYRYADQAAFYKYVAELCGFDNIVAFYFIALELEPIPMPNVIVLSEEDLTIATASLHKTLSELAECEASGKWVGYCDKEPHLVTLPPWAHGYVEETLDLAN